MQDKKKKTSYAIPVCATSVEREGLVFVKKAEKKEQILDPFSLAQWYICDKQASSSFRRQYVTGSALLVSL